MPIPDPDIPAIPAARPPVACSPGVCTRAVCAAPCPDALVLAGHRLRPGAEVERTSRFGHDTWRLEPAVHQRQVASLSLPFATVAVRYRPQAKRLCYALLAGPLPAGERRLNPIGLTRVFTELRRFLGWADTLPATPHRPARPDLAALSPEDLADYLRHLARAGGAGVDPNARRAVRLLWRYRHGMDDTLTFDPQRRVPGWTTRQPRAENATDRIPEQVLGPLIGWALRFVDDFAPDILAAEQAWQDHRARFANGRTGRTDGLHQALRAYLDHHVNTGTPLPGYRGRPNTRYIAVQVGTNITGLSPRPELRAWIADAARVVGVTDHTRLAITLTGAVPAPPDRAVTGDADRVPWTDGIATDQSPLGLGRLRRMLHIACYITIAFLSGMRDNEVKHLRRGCLRVHRDPDGRAYRWTVTGLAFKGEQDPAGVEATWGVGEPAARAVAVLEQLHPPGQDLLFAHLRHVGTSTSGNPNTAHTTACTNKQLRDFIDWVDRYCATHRRADGIPHVQGRSWPLSTRQFRRTLAWFIARRPGGSIAGAIAYRHLSVQMFEGYAGTTDSGFRAEVEAEQALTRGEHLLALTDAHQHPALTGPAAPEAHRRLTALAEHTRFPGTVITDPRRLARLLRRADPAVYPGTFATCVYNPDTALCHPSRDSRGTTTPTLGDCRPLDCANTALTTDNLTALRAELDHLDRELVGRPALPPLLRHRLHDRRQRLDTFLRRHTPETP